MNGRLSLGTRGHISSRVARGIGAILLIGAGLVPLDTIGQHALPAGADPAAGPGAISFTPGAITAGIVPDGTCFAKITASGGGGASSPTSSGFGGTGGAGATISATFAVVPGQSYGGRVGAGAPQPTTGSGATAPGGAGTGNGGSGGTIVSDHRGGGGGGGTAITFAGTTVLVAGGGGGGGAAHNAAPAGVGGGGGFSGIAAGTVAIGSNGQAGVDSPGVPGGGTGGQAAAGGAGGVHSVAAARNGAAGTGIGTGNGGNGGPDADYDSGAGGGGGYTGGGGGASTSNTSVTGAGGGGGSSFVRGTSVDALATVPSAISGAAGTASPVAAGPGAAGSATIDWLPCLYDLALTKTVSAPNVNAGNKVTWTVTVKNNGPKAMTKGDTVTLTDTLPAGPNGLPAPANKVTSFTVSGGGGSGMATGALTCTGVTVGSAMPASTTCSRAYSAPGAAGAPSGGTRGLDSGEQIVITYEQIIASTAPCATITNTATVKDRPSQTGGADITGTTITDTVNTPLVINCYDLAITKTASPTPYVSPSGTITWTITVTNNGPGDMKGPVDTTSNPLIVTDTFPVANAGAATLTGAVGPAGPCSLVASTTTCTATAGLAAGQSEVLTYTQVVNAGAADGAVISNTATVTDPKTGDSNDSSTASTRVNRGALTLTKTASPSSGVAVGNVVTYTFLATNTGSVTVNSVTVTDPMVGLSALSCAPANGSNRTAGQSMTCTATRTVTQADVDAGTINNTATVTGTTTGGNALSATGSAAVTATQTRSLSLTKTASPSSGVSVGTVVTYTFSGRNTGTVTLHNVGVTDPLPGLSAVTCTPAAPATLAPNATISCTATRTVTQADVDAGSIINTGTISGLDPSNAAVSQTAGATVTATQTATMSLTKTASPSTGVVPGTVVTYTFSGRNTGTVTLHNVGVTDPLPGLSAVSCTPAAPATLAPNATISCTATYTVTQANVDAGSYTNTATIAGLSPSNNPVSKTASATVTATQTSGLGLTKTASPSTGVVAGTVVTYTFTGQNTGTVTLHNVTISDPLPGLSAVSCTPAAPATLAANATISCTATYTVTQANVDAGSYTNTATINGLNPANAAVTNTASATVTATQTGTLGLTKTASPSTGVVAGTVVTYTFSGQNTGTVTLHNVTISDPLPGLSAVSCTPAAPATLAPNATISCTATYTVTQANVDAGSYTNTATISGLTPTNASVTKTASKTVTATQTANATLTKSATPNTGVSVGTVVTYTYTGQNTGTVSLHNVGVTDPHSGLSAISCTPAAPATLAPNATVSCTATYTVTQADIDAGSILNTGTLSGLDPSNAPLTRTAGATVIATQTSTLGLTKTASPSTGVVAGTVVTYTFSGQNTGTTTLHNVGVTDPLPGLSAVSCTPAAPATLAPNATISCTATYTVTQADVDAGSVSNTATISGLNPANAPVSQTASKTVTADQTANATLTKSATPNTGVNVGTVVTYTFASQNTGTTTLHNVGVTDPLGGLSAISCAPAAPATLAPNATISCTATRTVTQADVDAGSVVNTGTLSGLDPNNVALTKTAGATVTANQTASLSLTKSASPSTDVVAGDVVTYTFAGQNTGTTTLHNVAVTDPMSALSAISCSPSAPATLAPNATISCSATYTVTQANVDAGSFSNTATISGLDPADNPVSASASKTVTADQTGSLSLAKAASPSSGVVAGDVVTYTFAGQNTGTVTLHNVTLADPLPGLGTIACTPAAPATLAPNATISCSTTYTVTQLDVDAGSYTNTATITGLTPSNAPVSKTASATVTADQTPSLGLTKTASPSTGVVAGDVVTYTFAGQNTGTVTLHNVGVTDPLPGLSAVSCTPAAPASLAPNATIGCTATYTVTQADVDAGSITNTATITGLDPNNTPATKTAGATVTPSAAASLALTKTASPSTGVVAGDVVTYTFAGQNTGAVTLHNVTLADPLPGLSAITCTPAAPATLAPNATISCSATYTVTQLDVDAGSYTNTATITGLTPSNASVTKTASATVTADQTPSLDLTKTASPNANVVAGDVVTYTFSGQNTGTVTLHNVTVADPLPGLGPITCTPAAPATLAPNATISCSATYTVTQLDVDAGSYTNTATITGLTPSNASVTKTASATVTANQTHSLGFTKTASPNANVVAGDVVTYTFSGQNTGTTTLHNVTVADPLPGLGTITCTPAAPASLAPNATISCTATYTVTQTDVDAGSIANTATINGLDPNNTPTTNSAGATVTTDESPALSITKTATPNSGVVAGDIVTYDFTVQNTGTVTLHNVTVTDPMTGLSAITCTPAQGSTLAPTATMDCAATYTVTQADVNVGSFTNTATATGDDPHGVPTPDTDSATVTADQTPTISLSKVATPNTNVVAGDTVTYTFSATNTGTVTLTNVRVTDPMTGLTLTGCNPAAASLAPGATTTCSGTYTVTQANVNAGSFSNTATVTGTPPTGPNVTGTGTATVNANQTPTISLAKSASPNSGVTVGDTVTYTFTATNTGTVTLTNVHVTDPMTGLSAPSCTPATGSSLAPNATMTCTATYTVTQADVDSGSISNTATVAGTPPTGPAATDSAGATVTTDTTASVSLTKTASPTSGLFVGDTVTYTMTATNTGAVSLDDVTITDPMAGLSALSCTPVANSTLGTGATMTCTATYTVTQADVDNGSISNTATVDAFDPNQNPVTDSATETVLAGQTAGLSLVKSASPSSGVVAGTVVHYGFDVTNTGTVSLTNVNVADPMAGLSAITCTPAQGSTLAPAATMRCDADYTVTQADVDAGSIVNTATATGSDPVGTPTTATDSATVDADQTQQIDLVKTASPDTTVSVGTTVTYTMVATNTGAVTVDNVVITDPMAGLSPLSCTPHSGASLAPGDTMTCTATYVVTAADTARGFIDNRATVDGVAPGGHTVTHAAAATVPTVTSADVTLDKKLENVTGSVATWDITVTNTGNTPYPGPITVIDALPAGLAFNAAAGSGWACSGTKTVTCVHAADLAVGASSTVTIKTNLTGEGPVTNTATMDVGGETVKSAAEYSPGGGFAFTGSDAQRLGLLALLGIVGGWFMVLAVRKRDDDEIVSEV